MRVGCLWCLGQRRDENLGREVWNVVRVLRNGMMDPDARNRTQLGERRNPKSIVLSPDPRVKGRAQTNAVEERRY